VPQYAEVIVIKSNNISNPTSSGHRPHAPPPVYAEIVHKKSTNNNRPKRATWT